MLLSTRIVSCHRSSSEPRSQCLPVLLFLARVCMQASEVDQQQQLPARKASLQQDNTADSQGQEEMNSTGEARAQGMEGDDTSSGMEKATDKGAGAFYNKLPSTGPSEPLHICIVTYARPCTMLLLPCWFQTNCSQRAPASQPQLCICGESARQCCEVKQHAPC